MIAQIFAQFSDAWLLKIFETGMFAGLCIYLLRREEKRAEAQQKIDAARMAAQDVREEKRAQVLEAMSTETQSQLQRILASLDTLTKAWIRAGLDAPSVRDRIKEESKTEMESRSGRE